MAKYGMYPQPVYHATLDDGRTVRMTVWQKADAPIKGFDWEACRRTILSVSDYSLPVMSRVICGIEFQFLRPSYADAGRSIIAAHLEQSGEVLSDDPMFSATAKDLGRDFGKRKSYGSAKKLRAMLDSILTKSGKEREVAIENAAWVLAVNDGKRNMALAA